jgi:NADH-quinone oxidoreductase subunit N
MLNQFVMPDLMPALPELFLLGMACFILLIDITIGRKWRSLVPMLSVGALLFCGAITFTTTDLRSVLTFSNMFVDDQLSDLLKFLTYGAVITVLVYSRDYLKARALDKAEFYLLVLFATLGMMIMISANHLLTIYLGIELLSLSLYALVAIERDSARATEAAMKYFVLGALASGLLLYGMSMIYGATGNLEIGAIAQAIGQGEGNHAVLMLGLVFLVAGIAFKLGVVPFHMWLPDVYHGAPTAVTLFIASAPKLAGFAIVMRLLVSGLFDLAQQWQSMLLVMAVLSIALGNLAAIAQTNIKRMLAYSAISHMGFMMLALTTGVVQGDPSNALPSYTSAMYYTVAYVLTSLATFGMILLLSRPGFEAENLDDFKGLNKRSPWFAALTLVLMFSMAGIPIFIGFFAKFAVLSVLVAAGYVKTAVFAVLFSLIGAFYYLRVVKLMYFDAPTDNAPLQATLPIRILLSANALAVVALGVMPQYVIRPCLVALRLSLGS